MHCQEISNYLNDYLDGTLSPPKKQEIEAHLKQCPACSDLLQNLQMVRAALQELPQISVPPSLAEKLYQIPARKKKRRLYAWLRLLARPLPQQLIATLATLSLAISFYTFLPNRDILVKYINQQLHLGYHHISSLWTEAEAISVKFEKVGDSLKAPLQVLKEERKED